MFTQSWIQSKHVSVIFPSFQSEDNSKCSAPPHASHTGISVCVWVCTREWVCVCISALSQTFSLSCQNAYTTEPPPPKKWLNGEMSLKQTPQKNSNQWKSKSWSKNKLVLRVIESNIHSSLLKASRLRLSLCFRGLVQTLQATLCGHFLPRPRGGEITRNKLYISL